jgi:hypothetical protein
MDSLRTYAKAQGTGILKLGRLLPGIEDNFIRLMKENSPRRNQMLPDCKKENREQ